MQIPSLWGMQSQLQTVKLTRSQSEKKKKWLLDELECLRSQGHTGDGQHHPLEPEAGKAKRKSTTFLFQGKPPWSSPRCMPRPLTVETVPGREGRARRHIPSFQDLTQSCMHGVYSRCIAQAFLTQPHLASCKGGWKMLFLMCDHVPGFAPVKERRWLLVSG